MGDGTSIKYAVAECQRVGKSLTHARAAACTVCCSS